MLSESGKNLVANKHKRDEARMISPGLEVYSVTIVDNAENGLPSPFVRENTLVFTKIGNNLPFT